MSSIDVSSLTDEQQYVLHRIVSKGTHFNESQDLLILDSPGGCGKTHVLRAACSLMDGGQISYQVATFTGRAASQVSKEGVNNVSTLHSLLLKAVLDDNGDLLYFTEKDHNEVAAEIGNVLICDESSMIPSEMYNRMKTICDAHQIKFVLIGDSAQLEPIEPEATKGFNCMDQVGEHVKLTRNFRQEDGSSIAELCMHLRENNSFPLKKSDDLKMTSKASIKNIDFHKTHQFDAIICGVHKTRKQMNRLVRAARGFDGEIAGIGEKVVCRQNDVIDSAKINNGELYTVEMVFPSERNGFHDYVLTCDDKDLRVRVTIPDIAWTESEKFGRKMQGMKVQSFQFGYCLTCHSMQGSQAERVLLIDDNVSFFLDSQRWRYTGASRASEFLMIAK